VKARTQEGDDMREHEEERVPTAPPATPPEPVRAPRHPAPETDEHPAPGIDHEPEPDAENMIPVKNRPGTL